MQYQLGTTEICDTFAEAFPMRLARLVVTAIDAYWLNTAVAEFCGYGTSVIGCDAEVGMERHLDPVESPDGRPAASILVFGFSDKALAKAIVARTGQCLMTCPTTAVFDGLPDSNDRLPLGNHLRFFGDGFQKSKLIGERRFWRIPVMDGEFLIEDRVGLADGVAGGNLLIESITQSGGLLAARRSIEAMAPMPGVITPFPGGIVRSGSKVGSRYSELVASTSDEYCPTLRGRVKTKIHAKANCVYEIVIDGTSMESVAEAMAAGMQSAAISDVVAISAGNYGGELGKFHFHLRQILETLLPE